MSIYTKVADDGGKWVEIGASSGGGELPGIGGWATITEVTGTYTPHRYNDGVTDWVAYEFTDDGTVTTSDGLMDCLVVAGGAAGGAGAFAGGGAFITGIQQFTSGNLTVKVGEGATAPGTNAGWSQLGDFKPVGPTTVSSGGGQHLGYPGDNPAAGFSSSITQLPVQYSRSNIATPPTNTGSGSNSGPGAAGVVIVRVPKAYADGVAENFHGWESFALVNDGVVTNVTKVPDNEPRTLDAEWVPGSADVQVGWGYVEGEFVSPEPTPEPEPEPEAPAGQIPDDETLDAASAKAAD